MAPPFQSPPNPPSPPSRSSNQPSIHPTERHVVAVRRTLRLDELHRVLAVWRRMALLTEQDPDKQRQMLTAAAEIRQTGKPRPGSSSWEDLRKELGL
ncbi:DUF6247 family protein [Kibdelosporangium philippinense]